MGRLADAILGDTSYNLGRKVPTVDLKYGGQNGEQVDLPAYVNTTPYIKRNLVARLIECPRGFQDLDNPDVLCQTLKALVELQPKTIEGLNAMLTVEFGETPFGGAGEVLEAVRNVTRARSQPVFGYNEKTGRPITTFHEYWIQELGMDPITKIPNVATRTGLTLADMLPDYTGMTVLFFEPEITFTKVDKAWLCTAMFPRAGAPVEGSRDISNPGDILDFTIEYTAVTQVGEGVVQFAQALLDQMNLSGTNPNLRPAFINQITADVAKQGQGFAEQIATDGATGISQ
jgi:hypothetical protein